MNLDARSRALLKSLIEHYILDGQPVGSRTLSKHSGLDLSAATIRNVMADLEEAGLVTSPHTSAGRIPTTQGYRFFVDKLLSIQPIEKMQKNALEMAFEGLSAQQLMMQASTLLSQLTHFASLVMIPKQQESEIRHIEFVHLSAKRILLIIVTTNGDVQNRLIRTERDYSSSELSEAAYFLNQHYAGLSFSAMQKHLKNEMLAIKKELKPLMQETLAAGVQALNQESSSCVIKGEKNLLDSEDLSANRKRLRELFDLFEQKSLLMGLLNLSNHAPGVQIFIGQESGIESLHACSVIAAPYFVEGKVFGTLGVIGPTRMAYEQIISIVDVTAHLLSNALCKTL